MLAKQRKGQAIQGEELKRQQKRPVVVPSRRCLLEPLTGELLPPIDLDNLPRIHSTSPTKSSSPERRKIRLASNHEAGKPVTQQAPWRVVLDYIESSAYWREQLRLCGAEEKSTVTASTSAVSADRRASITAQPAGTVDDMLPNQTHVNSHRRASLGPEKQIANHGQSTDDLGSKIALAAGGQALPNVVPSSAHNSMEAIAAFDDNMNSTQIKLTQISTPEKDEQANSSVEEQAKPNGGAKKRLKRAANKIMIAQRFKVPIKRQHSMLSMSAGIVGEKIDMQNTDTPDEDPAAGTLQLSERASLLTNLQALVHGAVNGSFDFLCSDDQGNNLMHILCRAGVEDMVITLLDAMADRAEILCESKGITSEDQVEIQVAEAAEAFVRTPNFAGCNALHQVAASGDEGTLRVILSARAEVNETDLHGHTACMFAACHGRLSVLSPIVELAGANPRQADASGTPAVFYALLCGHFHVMHWILTRFPDQCQAWDGAGRDLLRVAMDQGRSMEFISDIVNAGCPVDRFGPDGHTCMSVAIILGRADVVSFIERQWSVHRPTALRATERILRLFDRPFGGNLRLSERDGDTNQLTDTAYPELTKDLTREANHHSADLTPGKGDLESILSVGKVRLLSSDYSEETEAVSRVSSSSDALNTPQRIGTGHVEMASKADLSHFATISPEVVSAVMEGMGMVNKNSVQLKKELLHDQPHTVDQRQRDYVSELLQSEDSPIAASASALASLPGVRRKIPSADYLDSDGPVDANVEDLFKDLLVKEGFRPRSLNAPRTSPRHAPSIGVVQAKLLHPIAIKIQRLLIRGTLPFIVQRLRKVRFAQESVFRAASICQRACLRAIANRRFKSAQKETEEAKAAEAQRIKEIGPVDQRTSCVVLQRVYRGHKARRSVMVICTQPDCSAGGRWSLIGTCCRRTDLIRRFALLVLARSLSQSYPLHVQFKGKVHPMGQWAVSPHALQTSLAPHPGHTQGPIVTDARLEARPGSKSVISISSRVIKAMQFPKGYAHFSATSLNQVRPIRLPDGRQFMPAGVLLQSAWRGHAGRMKYEEARREALAKAASMLIQSSWRGHKGRDAARARLQQIRKLAAAQFLSKKMMDSQAVSRSRKVRMLYRSMAQKRAGKMISRVYIGHMARKKHSAKIQELGYIAVLAIRERRAAEATKRAQEEREMRHREEEKRKLLRESERHRKLMGLQKKKAEAPKVEKRPKTSASVSTEKKKDVVKRGIRLSSLAPAPGWKGVSLEEHNEALQKSEDEIASLAQSGADEVIVRQIRPHTSAGFVQKRHGNLQSIKSPSTPKTRNVADVFADIGAHASAGTPSGSGAKAVQSRKGMVDDDFEAEHGMYEPQNLALRMPGGLRSLSSPRQQNLHGAAEGQLAAPWIWQVPPGPPSLEGGLVPPAAQKAARAEFEQHFVRREYAACADWMLETLAERQSQLGADHPRCTSLTFALIVFCLRSAETLVAFSSGSGLEGKAMPPSAAVKIWRRESRSLVGTALSLLQSSQSISSTHPLMDKFSSWASDVDSALLYAEGKYEACTFKIAEALRLDAQYRRKIAKATSTQVSTLPLIADSVAFDKADLQTYGLGTSSWRSGARSEWESGKHKESADEQAERSRSAMRSTLLAHLAAACCMSGDVRQSIVAIRESLQTIEATAGDILQVAESATSTGDEAAWATVRAGLEITMALCNLQCQRPVDAQKWCIKAAQTAQVSIGSGFSSKNDSSAARQTEGKLLKARAEEVRMLSARSITSAKKKQ